MSENGQCLGMRSASSRNGQLLSPGDMMLEYAVAEGWLGETVVGWDRSGIRIVRLGPDLAGLERGRRVSAAAAPVAAVLAAIEEPWLEWDGPPISPVGTPFRQRVWRELRRIPAGEVRSYGDIARAIGRPGAARAVGAACGANPVAVLIPCHRAVGADGSMTGFRWAVDRKVALLEREGWPRHPERSEGMPRAQRRGSAL